MRQQRSRTSPSTLTIILISLLAIVVLIFAGFNFFRNNTATPAPTTPPTASGTQITLDSPTSGVTVGSPMILSGRVTPRPPNNAVSYRVFGPADTLLASGSIQLQGDPNGPGSFAQPVSYSLDQAGQGRIEVLALDPSSGAVLAITSLNIALNANPSPPEPGTAVPTSASVPTAMPTIVGTDQTISIDTPPSGTTVGSPVVITGRSAQMPASGQLSYLVRDAVGAVIGSGQFAVSQAASGGTFTASIVFNLPAQGGPISIDLVEPAANGGARASAAIRLMVAPPQAITFESPPPRTTVGSPVVITGRSARYPFQGNLAYRFTDASGQVLGEGFFPVNGNPGGPATFNASLQFNLPAQGGNVRLEVYDQNAVNNEIVANASLDLTILPPPQAIKIETPPPGTLVGSPVVLTGRVVRPPVGGQISYLVRGPNGTNIGQGSFTVNGTTFNAAISFTLPPQGGAISIELRANDSSPTQPPVTTTIGLNVNPTTPPITSQEIVIETPSDGTTVGNPVVLTGRAALRPADGNLNYRVLTIDGSEIARGIFPVVPSLRNDNIPWQVSINFPTPRTAQDLIIEIADRPDDAEPTDDERNDVARDRVQVRFN